MGDEPCGSDLEYEPAFLQLAEAAAGKPETQFAAAEAPNWPEVKSLAEALLARTRDLRVAMWWARAVLNLEGIGALPEILRLLHGLLDTFWEQLHPGLDPDDGDAFARTSTLGSLDTLDGLLGDLRQAKISNDRRLGGLRVRDIEIGLDRLTPKPDESPRTGGQITGMLGELPELTEQLRATCASSRAALLQLQRLMNDRFGADSAVDVKALKAMLDAVTLVLPAALPDQDDALANDTDTEAFALSPASSTPRRGGGLGLTSIDSRQDAITAIQMVCAYLERSEPTNPAQFLLRRAERLINKNFLQLVRDLAPEAVAEIARIMGVDPDSIQSDD
ncbi:type VI secretion system protein TssA [Roseateles sp. GG27B]